jgi:hypothetical protein
MATPTATMRHRPTNDHRQGSLNKGGQRRRSGDSWQSYKASDFGECILEKSAANDMVSRTLKRHPDRQEFLLRCLHPKPDLNTVKLTLSECFQQVMRETVDPLGTLMRGASARPLVCLSLLWGASVPSRVFVAAAYSCRLLVVCSS